MFRIVVTTYKRGDVRRNSQHQTHVKVLKVKTYQLNRFVKVVVVDEHPIFEHALEGRSIQIDMEGDGVLLGTSRHPYAEKGGVEVAYVCNRRLPLVE